MEAGVHLGPMGEVLHSGWWTSPGLTSLELDSGSHPSQQPLRECGRPQAGEADPRGLWDSSKLPCGSGLELPVARA